MKTVKDLKFDQHNFRKHSEKNKHLLRKSVEECGLGRSIVVDNDGVIVGGNGIAEQLPQDTPIKVVETQGNELVVVKRTDLSYNDAKRQKLAILDNSTSDASEFDFSLLEQSFDLPTLNDLGIEFKVPDISYSNVPAEDFNQDPYNPDAGPQRPLTPDLVNKEIDVDNFGEDLNLQCPRCGFRFKENA